ncbi:hypothetical protein VTJ49DRAFT_2544 [Mycothermus thermophilus]|uniref:Extracellular membrane protein CFEM domain-containing protein n=1 Tax=Humicola insolens TaxID=85995 RepID=A0ABR3VAX6_HUMIN
MKSILATTLLASLAMAANPIFNETPYDECNACLDDALTKCKGDLETTEFAHCMCDIAPNMADGYKAYIDCWVDCTFMDQKQSNSIDEVANALAHDHASYCVRFLPDEWCNSFDLDDDTKEKYCGGTNSSSGNNDAAGSSTDSGSPNAAALTGVPAWLMAVGLGMAAANL